MELRLLEWDLGILRNGGISKHVAQWGRRRLLKEECACSRCCGSRLINRATECSTFL